MSDAAIVDKAKRDLDTILGRQSIDACVLYATIVRLPNAVNWYSPGSYANMPDVRSSSIPNVHDLVRSRHGSWSQEKAYVTGKKAANPILNRKEGTGILKLIPDKPHVALGRDAARAIKTMIGVGNASRAPSSLIFLGGRRVQRPIQSHSWCTNNICLLFRYELATFSRGVSSFRSRLSPQFWSALICCIWNIPKKANRVKLFNPFVSQRCVLSILMFFVVLSL